MRGVLITDSEQESIVPSFERATPKLVICDVTALTDPDIETVDALCRLELTARRQGARLVLIRAGHDLRRLLMFAGLRDVVLVEPELGLERERQTEEREQMRSVEEEARPDDPAV